MAVTHIVFNASPSWGAMLRQSLRDLENGLDGLNDTIACMSRMIDGDGSSEAHFTYMVNRYGFTTNAEAKAAFEELNSLASKLNTNASVTDVNAALLQAFSKFR